jgi:hypothetical protein
MAAITGNVPASALRPALVPGTVSAMADVRGQLRHRAPLLILQDGTRPGQRPYQESIQKPRMIKRREHKATSSVMRRLVDVV